MQIAIDARFYGLYHAGLGRYTKNLIHYLSRIDTDDLFTLFVLEKYRNESFPKNFSLQVVDAPHHSIAEQIKLPLALAKGRYDLVHFPHFIVPILNFSTPFVVTIHDLIKHKHVGLDATTLSPFMYAVKNKAYRLDMWWAVNRSRHIITPTHFVKNDIVDWFNVSDSKISVTYEGIDTDLSNHQTINEPLHVLEKYGITNKFVMYVGNAYPYKRVDVLIDALNDMPEDITLLLVGSRNSFYQKIEDMAKQKGLSHRVNILGYVDDEELSVLYSQASVFVSASAEEGFGIPPLEAMSASCPVVLSDIPVHREVCGDGALYVNEGDSQGFARKVNDLNSNSTLRNTQINLGLGKVTEYSWERMATETLSLYHSSIKH